MTTVPNKFVGQIHERQPVIIDKENYEKWLDPKTPPDEVTPMLNAINNDRLEAWPVSDAAKDSKYKGVDVIEPIGPRI